MRKYIAALILLLMTALLAGCGNGPKNVKITVQEMKFSTNKITLQVGRPARLTLINRDTVIHDLSVEEIPVYISSEAEGAHDHDSTTQEPDLHVSAKPGAEGVIEFIPTVAGTYTFICTVPGHEGMGMTGTLIVEK